MFKNWSQSLILLQAIHVVFLPAWTTAQSVFAHVIVGNNGAYTPANWTKDIMLASSFGIDAFVLNIGTPFEGTTATQLSYAYLAANELINSHQGDFQLFISFDYLGGTAGPWTAADIEMILTAYGRQAASFTVDGKPLASTFEGTTSDQVRAWTGIRSALQSTTVGDIYLLPCWTSLGATGFDASLVDGAFSWDMWPNGPVDVNTASDQTWQSAMNSSGKSFMMGVSPWFYTNLPQYSKAWVWRGDNAWSLRWAQTQSLLPQFVEIVTWNDYGEAHYIGPIVNSSIPPGAETYVDGYPHEAWLQTLPYQIAAYKHAYNAAVHPAPVVELPSSKIVYWYRTSPAGTGTTDVVGNNAKTATNPNGYQQEYPLTEMLQDEVFAIVLATEADTAQITIGSSTSTYDVVAGHNFLSKPFHGYTGTVKVALGKKGVSGSGVEITAQPADGVANFNAWVGCAGSCS